MSSCCIRRCSSDDTYIAYLPLAHVLELVAECCMLCYGATIGYGSPFTLSDAGLWHPRGPNGEVIQRGDAPTLRPTIMAAVPRIMDKVRAGIMTKVNVAGGLKAKLFHMAYRKKLAALAEGRATPFWDAYVPLLKQFETTWKGVGECVCVRVGTMETVPHPTIPGSSKQNGIRFRCSPCLLCCCCCSRCSPGPHRLVFDKIRTQALGGRVRMMLSGGGPLSEETQKFMYAALHASPIEA